MGSQITNTLGINCNSHIIFLLLNYCSARNEDYYVMDGTQEFDITKTTFLMVFEQMECISFLGI